MDNILHIFSAPKEDRFKLELKGPNLLQKNIKPVAKPLIENVKIITNGNIKEYTKNILTIRWINNNQERVLSLASKKDDEIDGIEGILVGYWLFTKDLIELNGNILKLTNAINIGNTEICIQPNQEVIITLTEAGLKKIQNMIKKWV